MMELTKTQALMRTIGQKWPVLELLHDEGELLAHVVGERYGQGRRWASMKLRPLRLLGLVQYTINKQDERERTYYLTERGRDLVTTIVNALEQYEQTSGVTQA